MRNTVLEKISDLRPFVQVETIHGVALPGAASVLIADGDKHSPARPDAAFYPCDLLRANLDLIGLRLLKL
jgi:hypothetical protein